MEDSLNRVDNIFFFLDCFRIFDMYLLESLFIDIMRVENDIIKGCLNYLYLGFDSFLFING